MAGIVAFLVILAAVVVGLSGWLSPGPSRTVWEAITGGIADGKVPATTALEAFSYLYEVPIPGVAVPPGIDGGDEPSDGTGAMDWVRASWSQLSADQQAVINRYLVAGPNDQVMPIDSGAGAGRSTGGTVAATVQLAAAHPPTLPLVLAAPDAPADLVAAMQKEFIADIKRIGPELGLPVLSPGTIAFPNIELTLSDTSGGKTLFNTEATSVAGHYEPCHVIAFKNAWEGQTVTGSGGVSPELHVLMTHEVVHCYQHVVWGSVATDLAMPPWIVEGSALYLAAMDTHIAEPMIPSMWRYGWFVPEKALTNRSYDAFGYYTLLSVEGRDLWRLMVPAWAAAGASGSPSEAFIGILTGDAPDIRDNWSESYLRKAAWGNPWVTNGFDLPADVQVMQHPAQANPAPGWTGSLDSRSNTVLKVDSSLGEVVTVSTTGLASVHDDADHSRIAFQSARFCVAASCICPKDTKLAGEDMAPDHLAIPFVAAFNAPNGGSSYDIVSQTLAELCGVQPSPSPSAPPTPVPPQPKPCDTGCADSNGDPHLTTVDQVTYDFQAAGEFTLLRSPDGTVDIQERQEPFASAGDVSVNTAVAARVGAHRVGVYATDSGIALRIDGTGASLGGGPIDLGNGARVAGYPGGVEVDFPDGTTMYAIWVGDWGIDAEIRPSASLKTNGAGLLGPVSTGGFAVPLLPDGSQLPTPTDLHQQYQLLYVQFADAWRVTSASSLFDYDAGKSTATYTIRPFPTEANLVTPSTLTPAQRAAGEAACAGITDPRLHEECVFDVGVTGEAGFAAGYAIIASLRSSPAVTPSAAPSASPEASPSVAPGTSPPAVVTGAVAVATGTTIGGYAVGPDDTVFLSVQASDTAFQLLAIDPRSGRILRQAPEPAATEVHLAAGSLWLPDLQSGVSSTTCSVTRIDPATLADLATVTIPCAGVVQPLVGSDGEALWFEDTTNLDPATGKGAVATRIDPATNRPGRSVPLPPAGGYLFDSSGALFYSDDNDGYYRLTNGGTAFEQLGTFAKVPVAAGTGLWVEGSDGATAQHINQSGGQVQTIPTNGTLVAGDISAAYAEVEVATPDGGTTPKLLRFAIDGSAPTTIASPPTVGGNTLSFTDDPPPTVTADGLVKLWLTPGGGGAPVPILLQWVPIP